MHRRGYVYQQGWLEIVQQSNVSESSGSGAAHNKSCDKSTDHGDADDNRNDHGDQVDTIIAISLEVARQVSRRFRYIARLRDNTDSRRAIEFDKGAVKERRCVGGESFHQGIDVFLRCAVGNGHFNDGDHGTWIQGNDVVSCLFDGRRVRQLHSDTDHQIGGIASIWSIVRVVEIFKSQVRTDDLDRMPQCKRQDMEDVAKDLSV